MIPGGTPLRIVGDVHGDARAFAYAAETDRFVVQLGDVADGGPDGPEAWRIMLRLLAAGRGLFVLGNHDRKLARWLAGRDVQIGHGLQASIDQLAAETPAFRAKVQAFLDGLRSHYWLAGGRLAVAHAGPNEEMSGRG